jgi:hypothetical protein
MSPAATRSRPTSSARCLRLSRNEQFASVMNYEPHVITGQFHTVSSNPGGNWEPATQ